MVCDSCERCKYKDVGKSDGTCRLCCNGSEYEPYKLSDGVLMHADDKKLYIVEKEGYSHICVKLAENEARALKNFLDWACLEDNFAVTPIEDYVFEEWGEKE